MPDFGIMRGFNEKLFGDKLVAGQLPTQLGLIGSFSLITPILDLYQNAAAAYSLRKLKTAYTGSAIRVRRSSDNTETDIGFSGANLDTTALTSFCSGTNGFVTTWYDQSGNSRNVTQTTAANQPQIVSSGSVILQNGKPTINFVDNTDFLRFSGAISTSINNTMATVSKFNTPLTGYRVIMSIGDTNAACYCHIGWGISPFKRGIYTVANQSLNGNTTANQEIWGSTSALLSRKLWINSNAETITNNNLSITSNLNNIFIGNDTSSSALVGNMQEAIFWALTQSDTDLVGINTNQNSYYAVY
jgi:hypothetical protein